MRPLYGHNTAITRHVYGLYTAFKQPIYTLVHELCTLVAMRTIDRLNHRLFQNSIGTVVPLFYAEPRLYAVFPQKKFPPKNHRTILHVTQYFK